MNDLLTEAEIVALCGYSNKNPVRRLIDAGVLKSVAKKDKVTKLYARTDVERVIHDYLPRSKVSVLEEGEILVAEAAAILGLTPKAFSQYHVASGKVPVKRRIGLGRGYLLVFDRATIQALVRPHKLTLREIGKYLGVSHTWVKRLRDNGVIPEVVYSFDELKDIAVKGNDHA